VDHGNRGENTYYVRPALCEMPEHVGPVLRRSSTRCAIWSSMTQFRCTTPSVRASPLRSLRSTCARRRDLSAPGVACRYTSPGSAGQSAAQHGLSLDAGLRKHAEKFEQDGGGRHAGDAAGVEGRRDLDEIGADEIEAPEIADQTLSFKRREAARLRRPRPWRIDRIACPAPSSPGRRSDPPHRLPLGDPAGGGATG
jgi:hypothetical protein